MSEHKMKILISGGGTGGHIFPALAIAKEIQRMHPKAEFLFVGARGRMEMEKVPAAGFKIEGLNISGLQRNLTLKNLSFPFKLLSSLMRARKIIKKFKPDVVVGTGGYASGPTLRMASSRGVPTLIQEQNSFPGITNKLLAKKADKICVAYENMEKYFPASKIVITGNPIRSDIFSENIGKTQALKQFDLEDDKKPVLLVIGGSQGAKAINEAIDAGLKKLQQNNIHLIWQTGKIYDQLAQQRLSEGGFAWATALPFIDRMDMAYAAADLVVSRAGAIAISEICALGKPAIFVPLPTAAEDHQTKNAQALVDKKAALLVRNNEAKDILVNKIVELAENKKQRDTFSTNMKKMARTDAAHKIAQEVLALIKDKK